MLLFAINDLISFCYTEKTVFDILQTSNCQTFLNYLKASGHLVKLTSLIAVQTIFAPTDDAFRSLDPLIQEKLQTNKTFLQNVINFHIIPGKHLTEIMYKKQYFKTNSLDGNEFLRVFVNNVVVSCDSCNV